MNVAQFLATVYLGDRACKRICIDGWQGAVAITIDEVSRVRDATGRWSFYTTEDIVDARLVFTGVSTIKLEPPGLMPNDLIDIESVEQVAESSGTEVTFRVVFRIGSVDARGRQSPVFLHLDATGVYLEDPSRPGVEIRE